MKVSTSLLIPSLFAASLTFFLKPHQESAAAELSTEQLLNAPYSYCFAPGTDPAVMERYSSSAQNNGMPQPAFATSGPQFALQIGGRWTNTATNGFAQQSQGDPVTITWSIVDDTTPVPAAGGIAGELASNSQLRARLEAIYGSLSNTSSTTGPAEDQPWFPLFEQVFDDLSLLTGITFVYEPNDDSATLSGANPGVLGTRADIRISGHPLDGNSGVLAYNFFPNGGDMVIDTADNFFDTIGNNSIGLRNTVGHEIGHGLGLSHVCPVDNTKLMEPFISLGFDGPQFDTTYSLQRNYGDSFEKQNAALSNDTFANASPIALTAGTSFSFNPLSIDDNSDVDVYSFTAEAGDLISATVSPSQESFLEGPQNSDGTCSPGVIFDSSIQQDLALTLFDSNQNQVATVNTQPAGQDETLDAITAPTTGTYYLQVTGDTANRAQLYSLQASIVPGGPQVIFNLTAATQTAENYIGQNGTADPLESVEYTFTLRNEGALDAINTTATLSGPSTFLPVEPSVNLGELASNQEVVFPLTFALDADCGESVSFSLTLTADGGFITSFPMNVSLGTEEVIVSENFDVDIFNLPTGWQSNIEMTGSGWNVGRSGIPSPSPLNLVFASSPDSAGESILTTPQIGPLSVNSVLSFESLYQTDTGLDGGVLEIRVGNGLFTDIVTAGGVFQSGGYAQNIDDPSDTNPLDNRNSWTGNSSGQFITTEVLLPANVNGQNVQFRWRFGTNDSSAGVNGLWFIDSVAISASICDSDSLSVTLSSDDLVASEFFLEDNAELTIESILPVAVDTPIPFLVFGTATSGSDYTSLTDIMLPAGSDSLTVVIDALEDDLAEGTESFTVSELVTGSTFDYTINDSPYGNWVVDLLGNSPEQATDDDPDGDGLRNLEEYLFGTDPLLRSDIPQKDLTFVGGDLQITLPVNSVPDDVLITPFTSPDLDVWNEGSFESVDGNEYLLSVPLNPFYFIRLRLSILENDAPPAPE